MMRRRARTRGFTLIEILISIAVFAFGGVAILSLFISMVNRQRQAAEITRATEIAANVRETLEAQLRLPVRVVNGEDVPLQQVSFPFATLEQDEAARLEIAKDMDMSKIPGRNTYYFRLPTAIFRGWSNVEKDSADYTHLPRNMMKPGSDNDQFRDDARVFYVLPGSFNNVLNEKGVNEDDIDGDDHGAYAFSVLIRRSTQRSEYSYNPQQPFEGEKQLLEGLYVVHIRVYKGYEPGRTPIVEETFTVHAPYTSGQGESN